MCLDNYIWRKKSATILALAGSSCCLSIVGALLVIVVYVCFKSLRNKLREIIFNLSLMDLGGACSNLAGVAITERFYSSVSCIEGHHNLSLAFQRVCDAQAFFSVFFTISSTLWIISITMYTYLAIMSAKNTKVFAYVIYLVCYGLPLLVTLWLCLTNRLGLNPGVSIQSCQIVLPFGVEDVYHVAILGHDLWISSALLLIPAFCLSIHFNLRSKLASSRQYLTRRQFWMQVYISDYKFLLIPVAFILLQAWWVTVMIIVHLVSVPQWLLKSLNYLECLSYLQGFVNFFLYVVLTKKVRTTVLSLNLCTACWCCRCFNTWQLKRTPLTDGYAEVSSTPPVSTV